MRYVLLLRGVNMMGKNTLVMSDLTASLTQMGFKRVIHYINSGNVFFSSRLPSDKLYPAIKRHLEDEHGLKVDFVILSAPALEEEWRELPSFWHDEQLKKAVLFFMPHFDVGEFVYTMQDWQLEDEYVHVGKTVLFWATHQDKSVYSHKLIKPKFLKNLSIRNGRTFNAMFDFL